MNRIIVSLSVVVAVCGISLAQEEPGKNFERLKPYGPMIGTWRYEGPLIEDVPDFAEKGSHMVFQFQWRRILNKNVVEETWLVEFEGGKTFSGKARKERKKMASDLFRQLLWRDILLKPLLSLLINKALT